MNVFKKEMLSIFDGKSGLKYYLLLLLLGIIIFLKVPYFLLVQLPKCKKSSRKNHLFHSRTISNQFWPLNYRNSSQDSWFWKDDFLCLEPCIQCLYNSWPFFFSNAFASTQLCTTAHPFLSWEDWHHLN